MYAHGNNIEGVINCPFDNVAYSETPRAWSIALLAVFLNDSKLYRLAAKQDVSI